MKALVFKSSIPVYEWDLEDNEDFYIKEFETLEDVLEFQENEVDSIIISKSWNGYTDYCDIVIEIYDCSRE